MRPSQPQYSTRSAAALVLVIAALLVAFGARTVSVDPAQSMEPPTGTEIAVQPTTQVVVTTESITPPPVPTPTQEPTLPPTATLVPTDVPTPTEVARVTVPPSGNDTESLVVDRGTSDRKQIAFTFDAGEDAGYTAEILDLLKQYGVHASFGVTGHWAMEHPDLMKRIVDEGHLVINHTEDHRSFTGFSTGLPALTDQERTDEIVHANDAIIAATGVDTKPFFRFPYNDYDDASLVLLKQLGYDYTLGYTCDTIAWTGNMAADIVDLCKPDAPKGGPGGVILMHVMQEQDFLALEPLLKLYLDAGYEVVSMDVMIAS